jgi:hypothetical protein
MGLGLGFGRRLKRFGGFGEGIDCFSCLLNRSISGLLRIGGSCLAIGCRGLRRRSYARLMSG